jgi:hypothetical protein
MFHGRICSHRPVGQNRFLKVRSTPIIHNVRWNLLPLPGKAVVRFEKLMETGDIHIRVLKVSGKIERLMPDYDGVFQMPVEGSVLISRQPGEEPVPVHFESRDNVRHLAEMFDKDMPSGYKYSCFLSIPTFCGKDTQRQLSTRPTISTLGKKSLKSSDCMYLSPRQAFTIHFKDSPDDEFTLENKYLLIPPLFYTIINHQICRKMLVSSGSDSHLVPTPQALVMVQTCFNARASGTCPSFIWPVIKPATLVFVSSFFVINRHSGTAVLLRTPLFRIEPVPPRPTTEGPALFHTAILSQSFCEAFTIVFIRPGTAGHSLVNLPRFFTLKRKKRFSR